MLKTQRMVKVLSVNGKIPLVDGKAIKALDNIAMRVDSGYIQYSTDNGKTWVNLIAEADLKGDKGDKGDPGIPGKDGHSPVVTATKSGKTTTISVDGTAIATVEDGADGTPGVAGAPGKNGTDGRTPVKGTDYWTASDKAEIVAEVTAALPKYGGETA